MRDRIGIELGVGDATERPAPGGSDREGFTVTATSPSVGAILSCPAPLPNVSHVVLGHGSGGKLSAELLRDHFLPAFRNPVLSVLGDAAVVPVDRSHVAITTDSFVVHPLEFPGGNIGSLAVHGTLNDLAMAGARPCYLAAGFVLEEGLPIDVLDRVVAAMGAAASAAGVPLVAGDTKVVERGKADGMFVTTTGIGLVDGDFRPVPSGARVGDAVVVSGPIGVHGVTILAARGDLGIGTELESDSAALWPLVCALRHATRGDVHALRDPTRGGVASALNEIAVASNVGIVLDEPSLPVPETVAAACELLGLDPLYVANEGIFVAFVPRQLAEHTVAELRQHPLGRHARVIGHTVADHPGMVALRTALGGTRVVDLLPGDQLPRIC